MDINGRERESGPVEQRRCRQEQLDVKKKVCSESGQEMGATQVGLVCNPLEQEVSDVLLQKLATRFERSGCHEPGLDSERGISVCKPSMADDLELLDE
eukprot:Nk52_evm1s2130 gene=Nk52_evmTU1s2130